MNSLSNPASPPILDRRPDDLEWIGELAETHNLLGVAYQKLGQYDRALEEYR